MNTSSVESILNLFLFNDQYMTNARQKRKDKLAYKRLKDFFAWDDTTDSPLDETLSSNRLLYENGGERLEKLRKSRKTLIDNDIIDNDGNLTDNGDRFVDEMLNKTNSHCLEWFMKDRMQCLHEILRFQYRRIPQYNFKSNTIEEKLFSEYNFKNNYFPFKSMLGKWSIRQDMMLKQIGIWYKDKFPELKRG